MALVPLRYLLCAGLFCCAGNTPPSSPRPTVQAIAAPSQAEGAKAANGDPLLAKKSAGWKRVDAQSKAHIDAFAGEYLVFAKAHVSQRQSNAALLAMAIARGASPFARPGERKVGDLLYWQDAGHKTLVLLKVGRDTAAGVRILMTASDAAHLRLTARPLYEKAGLALMDTTVLGRLDLASWLHTPLALHLFIAAPKPGESGKEIVIGDDLDEPVFSIPDLLPHLSRKVQHGELVDSPERLDAVAGLSKKSLVAGLARYGVAAADLDRAEAVLLPAGAPSYIGVDRALIAASNHRARALPYAAMRALLDSGDAHTQLVIITGQGRTSEASAGPEQHLANLLPAALAQLGGKVDALALRRIVAKSSVLLFDHVQGERNHGIALNPRRDDAGPQSFRHALRLFEDAGIQLQVLQEAGWSQARELASLDMNAVELGLPIAGGGHPYELVSTLDLFEAKKACDAWLGGDAP